MPNTSAKVVIGKSRSIFHVFNLLGVFFIFIFPLPAQNKDVPETAEKKPQALGIIAKPPGYDSTQTLEAQYKPENQYAFIGLQLYLPPVLNAEAGPILFSRQATGADKGNRYYTITGIVHGDAATFISKEKLVNQCGYRFRDLKSEQGKELIVFTIFELRDTCTQDTLRRKPLYWIVCQSKLAPYSASYFNAFIPIPYLEKQKQIYLHQPVILLSDKSSWLCTGLSLLRCPGGMGSDSVYDVFCQLTNTTGNHLVLQPPSLKRGRELLTAKEYDRMMHADRNMKMKMIQDANEQKAQRLDSCIRRFGKLPGELVAQHQIKTGMTAEMVQEAWGSPWEIDQSTYSKTGKIAWKYNWKYTLWMEKGMLIRIEH
jgi:hypothetical protein